MEESLQVARQRETLALICDIAYKNEAAWYDQTEHPLRMSLLLPKYRERHQTPMPLLIWLCGGAPLEPWRSSQPSIPRRGDFWGAREAIRRRP